jgi:uncharacterized membrane protein
MKPLTDKELDTAIANMLRWGVTVAAAVVLLGGILSLRNLPATLPDYSRFQPAAMPTLSRLLHAVVHFDPASIIQLGLLLLIATPILRVIFCVVGFALQRDRLYVAISTTVLLILLYSLFRGGR